MVGILFAELEEEPYNFKCSLNGTEKSLFKALLT